MVDETDGGGAARAGVDFEGLVQRASAGDEASLEELLRQSEPLIASRARKFFPNRHDAEEATQEALFAVSRRLPSFEGRAKYSTWLYQVTTNACIDWYRQIKRRQSVLVDAPVQAAVGSSPSVLAGHRLDLLEVAEQMEQRVIEPVLLRDLAELDYAEIAELLDVPVGTIKSRIHEGRNELRRQLSERSTE